MLTEKDNANLEIGEKKLVEDMLYWGFRNISETYYPTSASDKSHITLTERHYGEDAYLLARNIFPEGVRK